MSRSLPEHRHVRRVAARIARLLVAARRHARQSRRRAAADPSDVAFLQCAFFESGIAAGLRDALSLADAGERTARR